MDLFSIVPVKRSHSVCAQGGINAAKNLKGEGDTTDKHFDDTIYGGDFLANQTPVKAMCEAAPAIIDLLDRMGVPFNRTPEGLLDFRRFGGTLYNRTAFAGATTGQQLLYALDEQVRRYESEGKVKKYEGWEFLSAVIDSKGAARGITALDLRTMELRGFPADAMILATGGNWSDLWQEHELGGVHGVGAIGGLSAGRLLREWRVHPGASDLHSGRGQAAADVGVGARRGRARVGSAHGWATSGRSKQIPEAERYYFLEEWYPKYGNLVPRDVATRAIHKVVYEEGLGIDGQPMVYLDLTHIDRATLNRKLEGILEIYEKFVGDDPRDVPMKIFPGMHYTMGGLWVDFNQMTNIPGIFAAGECEYQYHGANRLGANSLLSCIFGGFMAGPNALEYAKDLPAQRATAGMRRRLARQAEINTGLLKNEGTENPFKLWRELGQTMTEHATVIRYNKGLKQADEKIVELLERYKNVNLSDRSQWANTSFAFARQLKNMLELSRMIAQGALLRDESRGAHYKPDFPERNDERFLKTTKASFTGSIDGPKFEYEEVDTQYIKPRPRRYDATK